MIRANYNIEHRIIQPGGKIKHVHEYGEVSYDDTGVPVRMVGTVSDITARIEADKEIRKSQSSLRKLALRLQEIREEERTRIAREIHDELGQTLTGLKIDLVWVKQHLLKNIKNIPARIDSMITLVDDKLDDTRKLAFRLRPAMLDDLGLEAAIECEIQDFAERAGYHYSLNLDDANIGKNSTRDTTLFRILQEALTNVARHANASRVDVGLNVVNSALVLTIRDNGIGIDKYKITDSESLGLIGMQERAAALGGQFTIDKVEDGGTQVMVIMPITGQKV